MAKSTVALISCKEYEEEIRRAVKKSVNYIGGMERIVGRGDVVLIKNRILKLNGLLVFWVNTYHFIVVLVRKNVERGRLRLLAFRKDVSHPHIFTLGEILRVMKNLGFKMIRGSEERPLKGAEYPKGDIEIRNPPLTLLLKILPFNVREHEFRGVFRKIGNFPL